MAKKFLSENGLLFFWGQLKTYFVKIEAGKRLITDVEGTKLSGIETAAQKNVQSDWNAISGDQMIKNKPDVLIKTDLAAWAKKATPPTAAEVGADASGTAQSLVNAEATARQSADTTLDGKITDLNGRIDNLNAERVMNKSSVNGGVIDSTLAAAATTCTNYMQTNYSRSPQHLDALILTLTDKASDKVKYVYFGSGWIDTGLASGDIADASSSVKGVAKLYATTGSNTDGAISQAAATTALGTKVDKVAGKVLSTNDYTTEEKNKLASLEAMEAITNAEIDTILAS